MIVAQIPALISFIPQREAVVPLNVDIRPHKPKNARSPNTDGVDCAYQPASTFDPRNQTLPWPVKLEVTQANDMILSDEDANHDLEGVGGLFEVLNFNKVLPPFLIFWHH